jgi:metal-sulfur cluster biosynthetic enzyme
LANKIKDNGVKDPKTKKNIYQQEFEVRVDITELGQMAKTRQKLNLKKKISVKLTVTNFECEVHPFTGNGNAERLL